MTIGRCFFAGGKLRQQSAIRRLSTKGALAISDQCPEPVGHYVSYPHGSDPTPPEKDSGSVQLH